MLLPKHSSRPRATELIAILVVVSGIFVWAHFRTPAPNPPVPKDLAKIEPQLRDYISRTLEWVHNSPRQADRHATLGLIYAVNGLWPEARSAFENAAVLQPDEPLARMYTGVCAQELGNMNEAIKIFRNTTERFPNFAPGFYRLGYASLRAGDPDEEAFRKLIRLAPNEWRGYAGLGEVLLRKGKPSGAIPLLEKAIEVDGTAKPAHHLLGQAYQSLGRRDDAEWELQLGRNATDSPLPDAWVKIASQHVRTVQGESLLATEFSDAGEPNKAVNVLLKAVAYHPEDASLMNQLAVALDRSGQSDAARKVVMQALAKDDRSVPALITLSYCEQKSGQNESALRTAERVISIAPDLALGYVAQANAFLAVEKDDNAVKALEKAERLDPQNPEIPMQIGDILWRNLGRSIEAKESYEKSRELDPVQPAVYVRLADLYLKLGEITNAQNCIFILRRLSPTLPDLEVLEQRIGRDGRP